ncbi:MAG: endonuclease/exonuclease/phosphatase family protein [Bacteroidales bacterium]|nr:endonuclease/exonuclease/phosphatase family protein [Bacteroidales bacterium]
MRSGHFLNTILFALSAVLLFSCSIEKRDSSPKGSELTIISHNVWYGFTQVPDRKESWMAWIQAQDPDIVFLQELNHFTPCKLQNDARSYGHPYSVLLKEDGFPTGITSRYPIEEIQRITAGFHHGLLRVKIKWVYCYAIHLHPSDWEIRNREIQQIIEDIQTLPANSSLILAGDFNTFSPLDSVYYSHGRLESFFAERDSLYKENNLKAGMLDYSVIRKLMDTGLVDLEAGRRKSGYRFSGSFPTQIEKEGEHGDQRRLDYIFVSEDLARHVGRAEIISCDSVQILSDHLPLIAELGFK